MKPSTQEKLKKMLDVKDNLKVQIPENTEFVYEEPPILVKLNERPPIEIPQSKETLPNDIVKMQKQYLFGLVKLFFLVEDRRPDLEEYPRKYKITVYLRIMSKLVFSLIVRSNSEGFHWFK